MMKKSILLAIAVLMGITLQAQEEGYNSSQESNTSEEESYGFYKQDIFISGDLGFASETEGDFKTSVSNITVRGGYFVSDNIAVGLNIGLGNAKVEIMGMDVEDASTFAIGVFGRHYFTPVRRFSIFGEVGVAYLSAKSGAEGFGEINSTGFGLAASPGISYFISRNFALEVALGILSYQTLKPDDENLGSTDSFDIGLGLDDINFGFVYKF